jgi:drug/metabolite transporter (DMT)-like permease
MLKPGVAAALAAALLFGSSTPLAKLLMADVNPWLMAGLLYLGSGLGLTLYRLLTRAPRLHLPAAEWPWFASAILAGGIVAPVLLMEGISRMPASAASLLLNAESVLTAMLAWFVFKENVDRRIALGMTVIVLGAIVLSWPAQVVGVGAFLPTLLVLGACLAWGLDNNLTRHVSLSDGAWIASIKGLVAGSVNLLLAFSLGAQLPPWPIVGGALFLGFIAYGISLALFVVGLRHLGTARTGAYFSVAPFFGAALAIPLLGESLTLKLLVAGGFMGLGVWLHLTEEHSHAHEHEEMEHEHEHTHDDHHQHEHAAEMAPGMKHTHLHRHQPMAHAHPHFPDAHHRHKH